MVCGPGLLGPTAGVSPQVSQERWAERDEKSGFHLGASGSTLVPFCFGQELVRLPWAGNRAPLPLCFSDDL